MAEEQSLILLTEELNLRKILIYIHNFHLKQIHALGLFLVFLWERPSIPGEDLIYLGDVHGHRISKGSS